MSAFAPRSEGGRLGAQWLGSGRCRFVVWAPLARTVSVHIVAPEDRTEPLGAAAGGYFHGEVTDLSPGCRYMFRLDGAVEFPDPASRSQPEGVHAPSEVVDEAFPWSDAGWGGHALEELVIYELHVGTFSRAGTFDGVADHLPALRDLGITAIELMPVAQFPGHRNWGYDGVYPFAVQDSYGGVAGLERLVDAAHRVGLSVLLDVVYNHFGPEGNYLGRFGPYFADRHRTPWGQAVNFDGGGAAGVRRYVVENAVRWVRDFHLDGLRLDAVHYIFDTSPRHILTELAEAVREAAPGRRVHVIAESDANDVRLVTPVSAGGHGLDAQWNDDFHHALHALLTSERSGYYEDFGRLRHLAVAVEEGFVRSGQFSPSRGRAFGTSSREVPGKRLVICAQNHDQVGNRMLGERLGHLVSFERLKLAAASLLLAPYVPLLFMGEEYAESAPFLYFVSHSDPDLVEAVRRGRREEFAAFAWRGDVPDPQSEEAFARSRLDHSLERVRDHAAMLEFHRALLRLRRTVPALRALDKAACDVTCLEDAGVLALRRWTADSTALIVLAFGDQPGVADLPAPPGRWHVALDSADVAWLGRGSPVPRDVTSDGTLSLPLTSALALVLVKEPH